MLGCAAAFATNRVLPEHEIAALYGGWLSSALIVLVPRVPVRGWLVATLAGAGALYGIAALPGRGGPSAVVVVEIVLAALAVGCLAASVALARARG